MDDIFAIQSEVSVAIAKELKAVVTKEEMERIKEVPTTSTEAYDLYLKALIESQTWQAEKTFFNIIELLEPAIEFDPNFLLAKSMLVEAYGRITWLGLDNDGRYADKARVLLNDIANTWPDRPERYLAEGNYAYTVHRDYRKALEHYYQVLPSYPRDINLISSMSSSYKRTGALPEFLYYSNLWYELDPNASTSITERLMALVYARQYDEAYQHIEKHPNVLECTRNNFCRDYADIYKSYNAGDLEEYLVVSERTTINKLALFPDYHQALVTLGHKEKALAHLREVLSNAPNDAFKFYIELELLLIDKMDDPQALSLEAKSILNSLNVELVSREATLLDHNIQAVLAAIAGDRETYQEALFQISEKRHSDPEYDNRLVNLTLTSAAKAIMESAEIGWQNNQMRVDGTISGFQLNDPPAQVKASRYWYDFFFADSPSYQAYLKAN